MRTALLVEYNGRGYHGWETQKTGPTVQAELERALGRIAGARVRTVCAGRTDARVHAVAQVVHFDCEYVRPAQAWHLGTNTHLPNDIVVRWASAVSRTFHARFGATRRRYRYVIYNDPTAPAVLRGLVTWECRQLDERRMAQAASHLVGRHDFNAYRARSCQSKSAVRTIYSLSVERRERFIFVDVEANAFLQHMVRNIVGVLIHIGFGRKPADWARQVLETRDRTCGGVTAPPDGLYLRGVTYPDEFEIPSELPTSSLLW